MGKLGGGWAKVGGRVNCGSWAIRKVGQVGQVGEFGKVGNLGKLRQLWKFVKAGKFRKLVTLAKVG